MLNIITILIVIASTYWMTTAVDRTKTPLLGMKYRLVITACVTALITLYTL